MLKVVVDTNVFISALLNPGNANEIVDHIKLGHFQFVYPSLLLIEIQRIPKKPKLSRIRQEDIVAILQLITDKGLLVDPEQVPTVCRDPDDDAYLACAAASDCDYLVSGDPDLLDLLQHGQTKIVNPAKFLKILNQQSW